MEKKIVRTASQLNTGHLFFIVDLCKRLRDDVYILGVQKFPFNTMPALFNRVGDLLGIPPDKLG